MDNLSFEKLLFTSAISVMACDGEIHDNEIQEVEEIINTEKIKYFVRNYAVSSRA